MKKQMFSLKVCNHFFKTSKLGEFGDKTYKIEERILK